MRSLKLCKFMPKNNTQYIGKYLIEKIFKRFKEQFKPLKKLRKTYKETIFFTKIIPIIFFATDFAIYLPFLILQFSTYPFLLVIKPFILNLD